MIIVSDTTPLRYLIAIEKINILEELFVKIIIPEQVCTELQGDKSPQLVKNWILSPPAWLEIHKADKSLYTPEIKIHEGEYEAIALALGLQADRILIDDRAACREAKRVGLNIISTLAVLDMAGEKELIDVPEAIELLKATNFYASQKLYDLLLERDRKRKESKT